MNIQPDPSQLLLTNLVQATNLRHRVLANNLANADTPGYIRKDVDFQEELDTALQNNQPAAFAPVIKDDLSKPVRADGNNVSLDHEMAQISENAVLNQMALQLLQTKLSMQRIAITGHS